MILYRVVVLVFLLLVSAGAAAQVAEEKKYSLSLEAGQVLVIEGHRAGEIKVKGTANRSVKIRGYLEVYGDDQSHIRQFYEGVKLEGELQEEQTLLRIIRPDLMLPGVEHAIFLEIQIPREMDLNLATADGRIEIREVSGDITLESSGAFLLVQGGAGNIAAWGLEGGLIKDFSGGEIFLETEQEVELKKVEGDIEQIIISRD